MNCKIDKKNNMLIKAHLLTYLINNKKIPKNKKLECITEFDSLIIQMNKLCYTYHYSVDVKAFFNDDGASNNITPNSIQTSNFIDYQIVINHTIKNKHMVESMLKAHHIDNTAHNFKNMKKLLNGKVASGNFTSIFGKPIVIHLDDITTKFEIKKNFKESIDFSLPNVECCATNVSHPLVFTHITSKNSILNFYIFSEENLMDTKHFTPHKSTIIELSRVI